MVAARSVRLWHVGFLGGHKLVEHGVVVFELAVELLVITLLADVNRGHKIHRRCAAFFVGGRKSNDGCFQRQWLVVLIARQTKISACRLIVLRRVCIFCGRQRSCRQEQHQTHGKFRLKTEHPIPFAYQVKNEHIRLTSIVARSATENYRGVGVRKPSIKIATYHIAVIPPMWFCASPSVTAGGIAIIFKEAALHLSKDESILKHNLQGESPERWASAGSCPTCGGLFLLSYQLSAVSYQLFI